MSRISILLVEDVPDDARLIERVLTRAIKEVSITCVDNLDDFKAQLGLHDYSLIMTDLNVGSVTGFDFISYLRQQRINKPIIMVTATNDRDYTVRALELQVDDYVSKSYRYLLQLPYIVLRVLNFPPSEMIEQARGLELKKIGEEYNDMFNADQDITFKLWLDGTFMSTTRNFERLLEFSKQEMMQMPLRELVDAASLVEFDHLCDEIRLGKSHKYVHLKLRNKYGKSVEIEAQIEPELSGQKLIASNWNVRDITNLRAVQKSFLHDYRQYASVFGFSRVPTLLVDNRFSILQINQAACRRLHFEPEAVLGDSLLELLDADSKAAFSEKCRQQMNGNLDRHEMALNFISDTQTIRLSRVRMTVIRDKKNMPRLLLLEILDES